MGFLYSGESQRLRCAPLEAGCDPELEGRETFAQTGPRAPGWGAGIRGGEHGRDGERGGPGQGPPVPRAKISSRKCLGA
jgi:hypothetical protein